MRTADQFLTAVTRHRGVAVLADTIAWFVGSAAIVVGLIAAVPVGFYGAIVAFAAVLIAAIFLGYRNWPTRFKTAVAVDAELQTHDLLSTAVYGPGPAADHRFVIAAADARFGLVDPATLVRRKIGRRGWSLVLITVAAAVVLQLRPWGTDSPKSVADRSTVLTDSIQTIAMNEPSQTAGPSGARSPAITSEEGTSKFGGTETERSTPEKSNRSTADGSGRPNAGEKTGGGAGQSQTAASAEHPLTSTGHNTTDGGAETGEGRTIRTGGAAEARGTQGAGAAAVQITPWNSPVWSQAKTAADQAVAGGAVPVRARAMVRDYFNGE